MLSGSCWLCWLCCGALTGMFTCSGSRPTCGGFDQDLHIFACFIYTVPIFGQQPFLPNGMSTYVLVPWVWQSLYDV